jgi:hypothetical protein
MDVSDVTESGPISRVHQLLPVNSRNEQLEKLGSAVSINVFGGKGLTTTTKYHSAILGVPVVFIRVISHVIIILHQIYISFEILHATPNNKLDH